MARILVVDDEPAICSAFSALLRSEGHEPLVASNGRDAVRMARREKPAAVFMDVRMPGMDGLAALREIAASDPALPVVIMTAYGTLETAAEALRSNAFDYLGKPLELAQVRQVLRRALHRPPPGEPGTSAADTSTAAPRPTLVGQSAAMQELFKLIVLLADNDLSVLVQGESGVGKELVARAIHERGVRAAEPFVAINCAAIPEQLIESEFFGHERGAFTDAKQARIGRFEAAGRGTLFLDEISELPLHLQSKLLRVLQERSFERVGSVSPQPFNARLVCATNRDLAACVAEGTFREDLFHRINLVSLQVPPLRDRREDIPALVGALVERANREVGKSVSSVEPQVLERFRRYDWPGNVRELEHVIKRSLLMAKGPVLTVHDVDLGSDEPAPGSTRGGTLDEQAEALDPIAERLVRHAVESVAESIPPLHALAMERLEQALIREALRATDGNQVAAARLLGISRSTLRLKIPRPPTGD
jgi:DNA-binding NtrC family response regulator